MSRRPCARAAGLLAFAAAASVAVGCPAGPGTGATSGTPASTAAASAPDRTTPRTDAIDAAAPASWDDVAEQVAAHLDRAVRHAVLGEPDAAVAAVDDAYYGTYEAVAHNLEVAVRQNVGVRRVGFVEDLFAQLREAASRETPPDVVRTLADRVAAAVAEDARSVAALDVAFPEMEETTVHPN